MGDAPDTETVGDAVSRAVSKSMPVQNLKKKKLGGPMNIEELKMNRNLLLEIHAAKKADKEAS